MVLLEPRPYIRETSKKTFQRKHWFQEVHALDSPDSVMELILRRFPERSLHPRKTLFSISGIPYIKIISVVRRITACLPSSKVVVLDDSPRYGFSFVVQCVPIHGYATLLDPPDVFYRCVEQVITEEPYFTSLAAPFLKTETNTPHLVCHDGLKKKKIHALSYKEWICFQYLVMGRNQLELTKKLHLSDRPVRNLRYRVMAKLEVKKLPDLVRLAQCWGLLDEPSGIGRSDDESRFHQESGLSKKPGVP